MPDPWTVNQVTNRPQLQRGHSLHHVAPVSYFESPPEEPLSSTGSSTGKPRKRAQSARPLHTHNPWAPGEGSKSWAGADLGQRERPHSAIAGSLSGNSARGVVMGVEGTRRPLSAVAFGRGGAGDAVRVEHGRVLGRGGSSMGGTVMEEEEEGGQEEEEGGRENDLSYNIMDAENNIVEDDEGLEGEGEGEGAWMEKGSVSSQYQDGSKRHEHERQREDEDAREHEQHQHRHRQDPGPGGSMNHARPQTATMPSSDQGWQGDARNSKTNQRSWSAGPSRGHAHKVRFDQWWKITLFFLSFDSDVGLHDNDDLS